MALPAGATHDWQFDNATTLDDLIGTHDLPASNVTVTTLGLSFNGTTSGCRASASGYMAEFNKSADWTLAVLAKPIAPQADSVAHLFQCRNSVDGTYVSLQIRKYDWLSAVVEDDVAVAHIDAVTVAASAVLDKLVMITVRYTAATKTLELWVDKAAPAIAADNFWTSGGDGMGFGANNGGADTYYGEEGRATTWDRRLTDAEITELFNEYGAFAHARGHQLGDYSPSIDLTPAGIATAEAHGTPTFVTTVGVAPASIASQEAVGAVTVQPGVVTLNAAGIPTEEATGAPTLSTQVDVAATGIASAEAMGVATLESFVNVAATGIASAEAIGAPTTQVGAVTLSPAGVASAEALGTPVVADQGALQLTPAGIVTSEAMGVPALEPGVVALAAGSIASAEAMGAAGVTPGAVGIGPVAIDSAETMGLPEFQPGAVTVTPVSFTRETAFGLPTVMNVITLLPVGIASSEAMGTPTFLTGSVTVEPASILSTEAMGNPFLGDKLEGIAGLRRLRHANIDRGPR